MSEQIADRKLCGEVAPDAKPFPNSASRPDHEKYFTHSLRPTSFSQNILAAVTQVPIKPQIAEMSDSDSESASCLEAA